MQFLFSRFHSTIIFNRSHCYEEKKYTLIAERVKKHLLMEELTTASSSSTRSCYYSCTADHNAINSHHCIRRRRDPHVWIDAFKSNAGQVWLSVTLTRTFPSYRVYDRWYSVTGQAFVWTAHKIACSRRHVHAARKRDARQKEPESSVWGKSKTVYVI